LSAHFKRAGHGADVAVLLRLLTHIPSFGNFVRIKIAHAVGLVGFQTLLKSRRYCAAHRKPYGIAGLFADFNRNER
jgi:hypothetical protein